MLDYIFELVLVCNNLSCYIIWYCLGCGGKQRPPKFQGNTILRSFCVFAGATLPYWPVSKVLQENVRDIFVDI